MAFLKVGKEPKVKDQRLYLMRIKLPGPTPVTVMKIGKASGHSSKERMLQINGSIFDKYRETAMIYVCKDKKVPAEKVFEYETMLHKFFAHYRANNNHRFDGYSECFEIDEEVARQAYDAVIDGMVPDFIYAKEEDKLPDGFDN